MKGSQIVLPASLQIDAISLAHEGHQYIDKTLQLLRKSCWFPKMRTLVNDYISTCLACHAASPHNPPVPLEPNILPERAWQNVHADFKGSIAGKYYLHIVIDQYSKFPEVDIVSTTSFEKLKPILDRICVSHGIPETISTDNGPPYTSHEMKEYCSKMGIKLTVVSPKDPQCNGFVENFVKNICKLLHTSVAEGLDPRSQLSSYLLQYRSTPHSTTEKSPFQMLYNRPIRTKLPQIFKHTETSDQKATREKHDSKKYKQKLYFDSYRHAKVKDVAFGSKVLIQQTKSTTKPPFNQTPLTVLSVNGNQVTAQWPDGTLRIRDKNQFKVYKPRPLYLKPSWETGGTNPIANYASLDIDIPLTNVSAPSIPLPQPILEPAPFSRIP